MCCDVASGSLEVGLFPLGVSSWSKRVQSALGGLQFGGVSRHNGIPVVARSAEMETPIIFVAMNYRCVWMDSRFHQLMLIVFRLRLNGLSIIQPTRPPLLILPLSQPLDSLLGRR